MKKILLIFLVVTSLTTAQKKDITVEEIYSENSEKVETIVDFMELNSFKYFENYTLNNNGTKLIPGVDNEQIYSGKNIRLHLYNKMTSFINQNSGVKEPEIEQLKI